MRKTDACWLGLCARDTEHRTFQATTFFNVRLSVACLCASFNSTVHAFRSGYRLRVASNSDWRHVYASSQQPPLPRLGCRNSRWSARMASYRDEAPVGDVDLCSVRGKGFADPQPTFHRVWRLSWIRLRSDIYIGLVAQPDQSNKAFIVRGMYLPTLTRTSPWRERTQHVGVSRRTCPTVRL